MTSHTIPATARNPQYHCSHKYYTIQGGASGVGEEGSGGGWEGPGGSDDVVASLHHAVHRTAAEDRIRVRLLRALCNITTACHAKEHLVSWCRSACGFGLLNWMATVDSTYEFWVVCVAPYSITNQYLLQQHITTTTIQLTMFNLCNTIPTIATHNNYKN